MIAPLHPSSLDERVIQRAVTLLAAGGLVAFPTDSNWSIGCDSGSREGIERLKSLKPGLPFTPALVTNQLSQWNEFVDLDNRAFREVKRWVPGPIVFIFPMRPRLRNPFGFKRPQLGLRWPDHPIPLALVAGLSRPLFAITASARLLEPHSDDDEYAEETLFEEAHELEAFRSVGLILDPEVAMPRHLSTVVDWTSEEPVLARSGLVDWTP